MFFFKRARTTNGETGPVADHNYEIWNCAISVIWIFRGKSRLSMYNKHLLSVISLHEQNAYDFGNFLF